MLKNRLAPLATLVAYEGANRMEFIYIEHIVAKIRNSKIDAWDKNKQLDILERLDKKEIECLIKMCNQIVDESWDEFSIISGYSLDELNYLKLFLISYISKNKIN